MTLISIESLGVTSIQDAGRPNYEHVGVSASGVADDFAYGCLMQLLQQPAGAPVFEHLSGVFTIRNTGEAPAAVAILGDGHALLGKHQASRNTVFELAEGERLTAVATQGQPLWIGIAGLHTSSTLGSHSFDSMATLGPVLRVGDTFTVSGMHQHLLGRFVRQTSSIRPAQPQLLRFIPGPHADLLDLDHRSFSVGAASRSGIRLSASSAMPHTLSLSSMPVMPGVIQLPPDGNPIVLSLDSGVTGGYPILGTLISADIRKLAWLAPDTNVTFAATTPAAAAAQWRRQRDEIARSATDLNLRP